MMRRRELLLLGVATLIWACSKKPPELRCRHCGMRIDPASAWRAELVDERSETISFDTPRCALTWRLQNAPRATVRVQEYYERRWRSGDEVRFVVGGDVTGPMGPDLVPVEASQATKFVRDHHADKVLSLAEITTDELRSLK